MRDDRVRHYAVEVLWEDAAGIRYVDLISADPDVGGVMSRGRAFNVAATAGPPTSDAEDVRVEVIERVYTRQHGSDGLRLLTSSAVHDIEPPLTSTADALEIMSILKRVWTKRDDDLTADVR